MRVITLLVAAAMFVIASQPAGATWRLEGCARCAGGDGSALIGATVIVEDAKTGTVLATGVTGQWWGQFSPDGCFTVFLPDNLTGVELVGYIDPKSLPAGNTIVSPPGGKVYFTLSSGPANDWEIVTFLRDGPDCGTGGCWLTGGGVKFDNVLRSYGGEAGPRDSFGGNIFPSCSSEPGNGGNVNVVFHGNKLHLKNTDITEVKCGNVDDRPPGSESPVTPFNYLEWKGTGTIEGIKGNQLVKTPVTVLGRAEDRNEPGNQNASSGAYVDRLWIVAIDEFGQVVAEVDNVGDKDASTVDPLQITGGNLQIHASSCDYPPPIFPLF